eukprot:SAG25_NODE_191_length_12265_cov_16.310538_22_plen_110_part_00
METPGQVAGATRYRTVLGVAEPAGGGGEESLMSWTYVQRGGAANANAPAAAPRLVSRLCAWVGAPCLRRCVHGAPIGRGVRVADARGVPPPRHKYPGRSSELTEIYLRC